MDHRNPALFNGILARLRAQQDREQHDTELRIRIFLNSHYGAGYNLAQEWEANNTGGEEFEDGYWEDNPDVFRQEFNAEERDNEWS